MSSVFSTVKIAPRLVTRQVDECVLATDVETSRTDIYAISTPPFRHNSEVCIFYSLLIWLGGSCRGLCFTAFSSFFHYEVDSKERGTKENGNTKFDALRNSNPRSEDPKWEHSTP